MAADWNELSLIRQMHRRKTLLELHYRQQTINRGTLDQDSEVTSCDSGETRPSQLTLESLSSSEELNSCEDLRAWP